MHFQMQTVLSTGVIFAHLSNDVHTATSYLGGEGESNASEIDEILLAEEMQESAEEGIC